MSMVKVWNLTDAEGPGQLRMVLGRSVKPGRAVQVEEARLERAHKVHRDVDAKLLYIGPRPPAWYQAKRKPPRAKADARIVGPNGRIADPSEPQRPVAKGHGQPPAEAIAADSDKAIDSAKAKPTKPAPAESAKGEEAPTEEEATKDGEKSEESGSHRPRRLPRRK